MVPDIIVAVLTGVIVGLVVLGAERSLERRRESATQNRLEQEAVDELFAPLFAPPFYDASSLLPAGTAFKSARRRMTSAPSVGTTESALGFWSLRLCCDAWERLRIQAERVERLMPASVRPPLFNKTIHRYFADPGVTWENARPPEPDPARAKELEDAVRAYCRVRSEMETSREAFISAVQGYRREEEALWDKKLKDRSRRRLLDLSRQAWAMKSQIVSLEGLKYRHERWGPYEED